MEPSERLQENLNLWIEPPKLSPLNVSHVNVSVITLKFLCYCWKSGHSIWNRHVQLVHVCNTVVGTFSPLIWFWLSGAVGRRLHAASGATSSLWELKRRHTLTTQRQCEHFLFISHDPPWVRRVSRSSLKRMPRETVCKKDKKNKKQGEQKLLILRKQDTHV